MGDSLTGQAQMEGTEERIFMWERNALGPAGPAHACKSLNGEGEWANQCSVTGIRGLL